MLIDSNHNPLLKVFCEPGVWHPRGCWPCRGRIPAPTSEMYLGQVLAQLPAAEMSG